MKFNVEHNVTEWNTKIITSSIEPIDKYFWCSRSVYAVEFTENKRRGRSGIQLHEVKLIKVDFEDNIIQCKRILFSEELPHTFYDKSHNWHEELLQAYIDDSFDSRTKEQFYNDFDNAIAYLTDIKSK